MAHTTTLVDSSPEQTHVIIPSAGGMQMPDYECRLTNEIGQVISTEAIVASNAAEAFDAAERIARLHDATGVVVVPLLS